MANITVDITQLERNVIYAKEQLARAKTRLTLGKKLGLKYKQTHRVKLGDTIRGYGKYGFLRGKVISIHKDSVPNGYVSYRVGVTYTGKIRLSSGRIVTVHLPSKTLTETRALVK